MSGVSYAGSEITGSGLKVADLRPLRLQHPTIVNLQSSMTRPGFLAGGYALLMLMIAVTVLLISLSAALPSIYQEGQREREEELIFRGNQYARAIFLFQRQFHRFPKSIDELLHTNNMSFLRHAYPDPMTPSGKWRLIHANASGAVTDSLTLGPTLGATPLSGSQPGALQSGGDRFSLSGNSNAPGTLPSGQSVPPGGFTQNQTATSLNQSSSGQSVPPGGFTQDQTATSPNQSSSGQSPSGQSSGENKPKIPPGCEDAGKPAAPGGSSSSLFSSSSQTQGLFIVGVASCSDRDSIRTWNKQTRYDEWEFLGVQYNPASGPAGSQPKNPTPGAGGGQPGVAQPGQTGVAQPGQPGVGQPGQPGLPGTQEPGVPLSDEPAPPAEDDETPPPPG